MVQGDFPFEAQASGFSFLCSERLTETPAKSLADLCKQPLGSSGEYLFITTFVVIIIMIVLNLSDSMWRPEKFVSGRFPAPLIPSLEVRVWEP